MLPQINSTINSDVADNPTPIPRLMTCNSHAELLQTFASLINIDTFLFQTFPDREDKENKESIVQRQIPVKYIDRLLNELNSIYDSKKHNVVIKRHQSFSDNKAIQWRSFVVEYDDMPLNEQIPTVERICIENNLPFPTCVVFTGNKSYHFYWTLSSSLEPSLGVDIQLRFIELFKSDASFKSVVLASRAPCFRHAKTGKLSELYEWTREKYAYEQLDAALPKLETIEKAPKQRKSRGAKPPKQNKPRGSTQSTKVSTQRKPASDTQTTKKNFIQEYNELTVKYNFYRRPTEEIEKEFKQHLENISNSEQGTVRATLLSEARKIFGLVFAGLFVNRAYKELYKVVEERVSRQPNGNIDEAYKTINDAFKYAIDNILEAGYFAEKPDYSFDADVVVNQKFLQDDVLEHLQNKRIVAIKSPIGTGKTKTFKRYVESIVLKYPDIRILIITHRTNLVKSIDNALENVKFVRYDDFNQSWAPSYHDRFITTVDSCHKLAPTSGTNKQTDKYDLVIFDEADQMLEHLTTGDTTIKNYRAKSLDMFNFLIKSSKNIICASATLSNIEINFLSRLAPGGRSDITTVENIHPPKKKKFIRYASDGALMREMSRYISNNKKLAVACNSMNSAEKLYRKLIKHFPNKKIELVTSKTVDAQHDLIQALINEQLPFDVDVVIYSSTLGTGFDISRIYFDAVFCLFTRNNALAATDLLQLTGRPRYPISNEVHVFVGRGVINQERDKNIIKNQYLDRCELPSYTCPMTGERKYYDAELNDTYLDYVAESTVRKNKSLYNLSFNYWRLVADDGHEIINDWRKPEKDDPDMQEIKEIGKEMQREHVAAIMEAPSINSFDANKLVEKSRYSRLNVSEQSQMDKYNFSKHTGLEATEENTYWYEHKGGKRACKNIELQIMPLEVATIYDHMEQRINGYKTQVDFNNYVKRKELLEQLLKLIQDATGQIAGRKKIHTDCFNENKLSVAFLPFVVDCVDEIKNYLGFTPDIEKPVKVATTILELVGLSCKDKRIRDEDNKLTRIYWITEKSQRRREQIIQNTQEALLKQWRNSMHSLLFNDVLIKFKHLEHNSDIIKQVRDFIGVESPVTVTV